MLWKLLFAHIQIPRGRLEAMEEDRQSCRLSVGLTSCTSLAKADPTPAPVRCPTCGQCVSTLSPQPGFIPQGDWLASWWQVNYLSTISTSGRAAEHSYWKLTFSPHLQSVLLHHPSSANRMPGLCENSILHDIFDQCTNSKVKDIQPWAPDYNICLVIGLPQCLTL